MIIRTVGRQVLLIPSDKHRKEIVVFGRDHGAYFVFCGNRFLTERRLDF